MEGQIFRKDEIKGYAQSGLHMGLWHLYRLRLAIFYGAPIPIIAAIVTDGEPFVPQIIGMSFGNEWVFLESIVRIMVGKKLQDNISILSACTCESS